MKTTIKQFVALAFFAFIFAGNVNAKEHRLNASSQETIVENALEMENWMTDASVWNTGSVAIAEVETEASLQLENWMIDASVWNTTDADLLKAANESALDMESWMTDQAIWEVVPQVEETETRLVLENWMVNDNTWKI